MTSPTPSSPNSPPVPDDLRDGISAQLDRFLDRSASRLGSEIWSDWHDEVALRFAQLLNADLFVWMAESNTLTPVFNGPRSDALGGRYQIPTGTGESGGVLSMVYEFGQFVAEPDVAEDAGAGRELDRILGIETRSLMAAPLSFAGGKRGVVSAIRFSFPGRTHSTPITPFSVDDTAHFECLVRVLGRLLDETLVSRALDLQ